MRSTVEGDYAVLKDTAPPPKPGTIAKARKLRRKMSLPEVLPWRELHKRPAGLKFRRQHAARPYVLDFCCSDARLAIEVDGLAHDMGDRPERDIARDRWFAAAGIETVRLPASDVLKDAVAAAESLAGYARSRLPPHHPPRGRSPSPSELGEDS